MVNVNKFTILISSRFVVLIAILAKIYVNNSCENLNLRSYQAVIGVLSARDHFEQRQVIRETWLKHSTNRILVKFVVGYRDCLIPPEYRVDVYQCVEAKDWSNIDLSSKFPILPTKQLVNQFSSEFKLVALDFEITQSIVVNSLAVPCGYSRLDKKAEILVELRDLGNNDALVVSTKFHLSPQTSEHENCLQYQRISPFLLPKGFQGGIVVHYPNNDDSFGFTGIKLNMSSVINPGVKFSPGFRYGYIDEDFPTRFMPFTFDNLMILPALFQYYIHDVDDFKLYNQNRSNAFKIWKNHTRQTEIKLKEEISNFNDIITVDNSKQNFVDVYRNLPEKLLLFYSWATENLKFDFIGKVDDDCYVNLKKISKMLTTHSEAAQKITWLGNFRHDTPVDRWGKWAEYQYTSSLYPAFACGAGNMVSRPVSEWLTRNREVLFKYQGEDVSMGIWLSVIHPKILRNPNWICDDKCENDMLVTSQHNSSATRRMWENEIKCGKPCGCE